MTSIRDTWLVARFELLRALRTWRAASLGVLYLVVTAGSAYIFTRILAAIERGVARTLGVATTDIPGTMMAEVAKSEEYRDLLAGLVGEGRVDMVADLPPLAIFHLAVAIVVVPMLAGTAAAECVAIDVGTRAIRYEALRTGRLEIAYGRYFGQLLLCGVASAVGIAGTWVVGMGWMVGNSPVGLLVALATLTLRAWFFSMPAVGVGVAISQLGTSAAWARMISLVVVAGSWVVYGMLAADEDRSFWPWWLADPVAQILPQSWIGGLWAPGLGWWPSAAVCAVLGLAIVALGSLRFAGRDL